MCPLEFLPQGIIKSLYCVILNLYVKLQLNSNIVVLQSYPDLQIIFYRLKKTFCLVQIPAKITPWSFWYVFQWKLFTWYFWIGTILSHKILLIFCAILRCIDSSPPLFHSTYSEFHSMYSKFYSIGLYSDRENSQNQLYLSLINITLHIIYHTSAFHFFLPQIVLSNRPLSVFS